MTEFRIEYPDEDDLEWDMVEVKGWLGYVVIVSGGRQFRPIFYDRARHAQEVDGMLSSSGYFAEPNLIVLDRLTKENVEAAIACLAQRDFAELFAVTDGSTAFGHE